jgi:hypothetical protein
VKQLHRRRHQWCFSTVRHSPKHHRHRDSIKTSQIKHKPKQIKSNHNPNQRNNDDDKIDFNNNGQMNEPVELQKNMK